jgi:hypothetical protein
LPSRPPEPPPIGASDEPRGDPVHRRNRPYLLLGTVHIAWTLGDLRSPTPFRPVDETVIAAMQAEPVAAFASAPGVRSLWPSWLGFNLSHGLGLLLFGVVPLVIAL